MWRSLPFLAVIAIEATFFSAISPVLPEYAADHDLSKSAAGILSASYAAGALLGALPSGYLSARIGYRPAVLAGLTTLALASLVFAFADQIVLLDLARFVQGVGGVCAWTGAFAWLLASRPAARRGEVVGATVSAAIVGVLLGPAVGAAATEIGTEVVFAGVAVAVGGLAVAVFAAPGLPAEGTPALREVARAALSRPVLLAAALVILPSILSGAFDVLVPLRMDALGAAGLTIGAAFFCAAALEAFTAPVIGRLSDRRGRMFPIRYGLMLSPIAALLLPLPETVVLLTLALVVVVLAMSLIWTPSMALLSDESEAAGLDLAFAGALNALSWSGGQMLGASVLSGIADGTSDATAYGVIAVLFVVALLVVTRKGFRGPDRVAGDPAG